ncbi:hypothetical protein LAZ67_16001841 [Cordylochernes scorpioides]|uniref:Reverse transcriptase domain-containing protein n=1 Tax=Cordylochernes scorpioides TaxID=51811 RepID=A0ABY6LFN9_9ARAC|nr:hypothetical protein LAZ67_16001841 [Cordylochernes scorpioides]
MISDATICILLLDSYLFTELSYYNCVSSFFCVWTYPSFPLCLDHDCLYSVKTVKGLPKCREISRQDLITDNVDRITTTKDDHNEVRPQRRRRHAAVTQQKLQASTSPSERLPRHQDDNQRPSLLTEQSSKLMVETRSGKMQDPAQERIEESAKPQPGATIGRDASSDPVVLNPNIDIPKYDGTEDPRPWIESLENWALSIGRTLRRSEDHTRTPPSPRPPLRGTTRTPPSPRPPTPRVRFVRIVEEDPIVTQDKVEEEIRMDNGTEKSRPLLYADKKKDGEYIIEENHKMFQTNGLRLARSLINVVNKETYIWITNPYPRPLKILKTQTLCFGSQPAEVNLIEESEQKEHEEPQFQINENLSYKENEQLKQVLEKYADLFSSGLGRSNLAKHRIDTEGAKPIKHKPYRVSAKEREIIKEQIDEMLRDGIIRPSSSPWSFAVILVKKRDGKYRFCVDYRNLNDVTVKDVYPIPRIDEVLDTLQGSKYLSAIDLKSGYWQVEVEEKDKEKTAFTTAHGLYEFNVMPFGLCNAPATFERNMENMLGS